MRKGGGSGRRRLLAVATAALLLSATACEGLVELRVNDVRQAAGRPELARDPILDAAADEKAGEICDAGAAVASPDPGERYDAESAFAVDELVGRAALDPTIADPTEQDRAATEEIWAGWATDASLADPRWDDMGIGQATCADGHLAMALVLRDIPSMPASGRYSTPIYPTTQIVQVPDLEYRTAVDHLGQTVSLQLDVFLPPASDPVAERPTLVLVHGGGFRTGSRDNFFGTAREYARRGYVAVAISYRLRPNDTPEEQLLAAVDAIDDGMEAIRWLKANAATYRIDTDRIGVIGLSAGAVIALAIANLTDPTPTGPLAGQSTSVAGVVGSGASLSTALSLVDFDEDDAAALMFHYETDTSTGDTDEFAFQTCAAMRDAGTTCDFVVQAGAGHTTPVGPQSTNWTETIGPFLWTHLRLHP